MKNKFLHNINLVVNLALILSLIPTINSFAFIGWYRDGDKMTYLDDNGYKFATTWKESDGMKFYLGEDGYVVYNQVFEYNGNIYYVDTNGARVTNRFVNITEDMINAADLTPGLFYFNEKGTAYKRTDNIFKKTIDGKLYAFDENYHVITDCWLDENGEILDDSETYLSEGVYYANADGTLKQNEWYNFINDVGSSLDMGDSNLISTDYDELNGLWMYFKSNGKKAKATENGNKLEKMDMNGFQYAFDNKGILILGFTKNTEAVDRTTQPSNPTVKNKIYIYDNKDGYLLKNSWLKNNTPDDFDHKEYLDGTDYWYFVDDDGTLVKNKIKKINNKKYVFDGFGRMRKGFIYVDGKSFYVAEYKSEDLSRDDFLYSVAEGSRLYGSDLSDLKYFDESELTEGEMKTGEVKIELNDGTYTFNFKSSGTAYGNKNELKEYKKTYYKNGLKLVPWEETKYGIVKVSDTEYKVVNANGKIIEGKRKILKDDFGNYMIIFNNNLAGYIKEPMHRVQLRWKTFDGVTGYYFYDLDLEKKAYNGLAIASGANYPTEEMLNNIPDDLKINFY